MRCLMVELYSGEYEMCVAYKSRKIKKLHYWMAVVLVKQIRRR